MASGKFVDPVTLLRAAPLITSTVSLVFSFDQHLFLDVFLAPHHREQADGLVSSYFKTLFPRGLAVIFTSYPLSIACGACNLYAAPQTAYPWFAAGTALALAHFAFVPKIMWRVKAVYESDEKKSRATDDLAGWLNVHIVRSLAVDLPAWLCFATACLKSLTPV